VSRPPISVVMPFAGDSDTARTAISVLLELDTRPDDELILADNSGVAPRVARVTLVRATAERSPAHARNAGAARARNEWILFLDADCRAPAGLLDAYLAEPVPVDVGVVAGEVVPSADGETLAARYGAARSFLSQQAHLAHRYRPRAVAANLLVRRAAFEQVGGFYEGVRAAEDTDFSWRIQQAGWRLELRPAARVEHRYRTTVKELRRQWRGYAAGRAWLARRHEGFAPQPAARRVGARTWLRIRPRGAPRPSRNVGSHDGSSSRDAGRIERGRYLALDALLAAEELAGLTLSNRPTGDRNRARAGPVRVVLVTDRFPARNDPLAEFASTLDAARVEAAARPDVVDADALRALSIDYREDDGTARRAFAVVRVIVRHPLRCAWDVARRGRDQPTLAALAPATLRLRRDRDARVLALGGDHAHATAARLAALAGRRLDLRP
jgi:GT2 family glycosyltransferase